MNPQTGYKVLKGLAVFFALNGIPGVLVSLLIVAVCLIEFFTGVALLPHKGHRQPTIGGTLVVLGMACFWAIEVGAAWLVWRRPSRLAIYLAVSVTGFWAVWMPGIALEVTGTGTAAAQLCVLLCTAAIVCWPCIAVARWLSSSLFSGHDLTRMAEPGAPPNAAPPHR